MRERSAYIAKTLADGQVAASWGAIFTAPNLSEISTVWFYNDGASVQTVDVAVTRVGETRRQIAQLELVAGGYATLPLSLVVTSLTGTCNANGSLSWREMR